MTFKPARLLMTLIAVAAMPVMAQNVAPVGGNVAVVNGKPVPTARLDYVAKDMEAHGRKVDDEGRKQLKDNLLALEEISQEAEKQGLGKSDEFKEKLNLFRQQTLAQALIEKHRKAYTPKESEIEAKYAVIKADAENKQEYQARHILVATEDEAKAIIVKLKGGAKFIDLAKEKSTEPGAAESGGELRFASPDSYVPEFGQALVKLQKGHFSDEPVHTKFGYHVILLEDTRKGSPAPALADIKSKLVDVMREEDTQAYIKSIRDKAVVK